MRRLSQWVAAAVMVAGIGTASAAEVGQPAAAPAAPQATAEPTAEQAKQAVQDYVKQITEDEGDFAIEDEVTGNLRTMTLGSVHDEVKRVGSAQTVCADMKDVDTNEALDVDFDVESVDGELDVVDVRIHKVNGTPRYTYDSNNNIVPTPEAQPGA